MLTALSIIGFITAILVFYGFYEMCKMSYPFLVFLYGKNKALYKLKYSFLIMLLDSVVIIWILYYWIF